MTNELKDRIRNFIVSFFPPTRVINCTSKKENK